MVNAKIITEHLLKNDKKSDILHSSGYARAQSGESFGAAGAASFEARQALDQRRKFVQSYRNSQIMNDFYGLQRARMRAQIGGAQSTAGADSGTNSNTHPMDAAMHRAQFSASTAGKGPTLGNARAPQIPNRRAGI